VTIGSASRSKELTMGVAFSKDSPFGAGRLRLLYEGLAACGVGQRSWNGSDDAVPLTATASGDVAAEAACRDLTDSLSPREREVLLLLGHGLTNKEVAQALGVAPETVKSHLKSIYRKMGVERRAHAVAKGHRLGLIGWDRAAACLIG
jgi:DNA-binding CsgD family transcriptional regulator